MKCLVTGATGFLGTNLVHMLVKAGWDVRTFALPGSCVSYMEDLPLEMLFGDIGNANDVDRAVRDVEIVFNVAGDTSWWKRNFDRQKRTNVQGPVKMAEACLRHGVRRIVHTSTQDALGCNPAGMADEMWRNYNFGGMAYNYADTKREGEKKLRSFIAKGLEVVIIYPGSMMGPFDYTLQYGRLFFDLRDGKVPGCPAGGVGFGHVEEVARAHIAAAELGRNGEGYLCSGTNVSYRELFEEIASKFGKHAPFLTMPRLLLTGYGYLMQTISSFTNKPPDVDPGTARYMSMKAYYNSSKAVSELGYTILPLKKMVDDAYDWYKLNGYL